MRALPAVMAVLVLAGCGGGAAQTGPSGQGSMSRLPEGIKGSPAPRVRLPAARGGTLDTKSLRGRPYALTFLYANCPDVCPLIADELREAFRQMGPRAKRAAAVAVSVDPRGDTRPAVREFLRRHRAPDNLHYLIGSEAQLRPVWKDWYAAPQIQGDPNSAHTAAIWLIDARGRIAGKFDAGVPVKPSELAEELGKLEDRG